MTYKGYTYTPWTDRDDDCLKIWHDFRSESGTTVTCDWSPYFLMSDDEVRLWIDLDLPGRIGPGPLNRDDLLKIRREQLETIVAINSTFTD